MSRLQPATSSKKRFLVPKEHGAWGILLVPFFVGLGVAPPVLEGWEGKALLLLGAILFLYLARYPLVLWARSGFGKFPVGGGFTFLSSASLGILLGAPLVFRYQLWLLLALGAMGLLLLLLHLLLVRRRRERTDLGEFLGICALTLTAPAAFYTSSGELPQLAFILWFLCLLHFGTGILYVKMKLARHSPAANPQEPKRLALALYQTAALASVATLTFLKLVPALTLLAFAPLTLQGIAGILEKGKELNIRRLGWSLVGQSVVFGLALIAIYRTSPFGLPS